MADQRRPAIGRAFRHMERNRGPSEPQFAAPTAAGWIPAGLRGAAESRVPVSLPGRQFRDPEGTPRRFRRLLGHPERRRRKARSSLLGFLPMDVRRRSIGFWEEFFPAQLPEGATGKAFVKFFQVNKLTGEPKGILAIRLRGGRRR